MFYGVIFEQMLNPVFICTLYTVWITRQLKIYLATVLKTFVFFLTSVISPLQSTPRFRMHESSSDSRMRRCVYSTTHSNIVVFMVPLIVNSIHSYIWSNSLSGLF
jgi:hypothetical protein